MKVRTTIPSTSSFHYSWRRGAVLATWLCWAMMTGVSVVGQEGFVEEPEQPQQHQQQQQEQHQPAATDCTAECHLRVEEAVVPVQRERTELAQELERVREQLEEVARHRDQLLAEHTTLVTERDTLLKERDDLKVHQVSLEDAVKQLEAAYEEMSAKHKAAERLGTELHGKLIASRDTVADLERKNKNLSDELVQAEAKIQELSSISFVRQLQKELLTFWQAIVEQWEKLFAGFTNSKKAGADL